MSTEKKQESSILGTGLAVTGDIGMGIAKIGLGWTVFALLFSVVGWWALLILAAIGLIFGVGGRYLIHRTMYPEVEGKREKDFGFGAAVFQCAA